MTENKRFDSIYYEKFCRVITDNGKEIRDKLSIYLKIKGVDIDD